MATILRFPANPRPRNAQAARPVDIGGEADTTPVFPERFVLTRCRHTGRPCPAALAVARALARADETARAASPGFEMTGTTRLKGCAATCQALFHLSRNGVALFCGAARDADVTRLAEAAQSLLHAAAGDGPLTPPAPQPLAFVLSPGHTAVPAG